MTTPDAREWYPFDHDSQHETVAAFKAAHPAVTFMRLTLLGSEGDEPWLCIEGWLTAPDDQGPAPTDADIPIGFG